MRIMTVVAGSALLWSALSCACASNEAPREDGPASDRRPPSDERRCENGSLSYGPRALPPALKGAEYSVTLADYADTAWYGVEYRAGGPLPEGLELVGRTPKGALTVRGVATKTGSFEFRVYANHGIGPDGCSTMPDPHTFRVEVTDADGGAADAGVRSPR